MYNWPNKLKMITLVHFTQPVLSTTRTSTWMAREWSRWMPNAIELSGTTTEDYWKDYQLLGLYNIINTRNGAPAYKRARNAFILGMHLQTSDLGHRLWFFLVLLLNGQVLNLISGEIYFWYNSRCKGNEWVITSKEEFDADKDCPARWLWKESDG